MKCLIFIMLLIGFQTFEANWIVSKVANRSDLKLKKAVRGIKNIEIKPISKLFSAASNGLIINLESISLFGTSGGCKIIANTPEGKEVEIFFLSDPTLRISSGRDQLPSIESRRAIIDVKSGMFARVFLKDKESGDVKLLGFKGYDKDGEKFQLILDKVDGQYDVKLVEKGM